MIFFLENQDQTNRQAVFYGQEEEVAQAVADGCKLVCATDDEKFEPARLADFFKASAEFELGAKHQDTTLDTSDLQAELEQSRAEQEKLRESIAELTTAITTLISKTKQQQQGEEEK